MARRDDLSWAWKPDGRDAPLWRPGKKRKRIKYKTKRRLPEMLPEGAREHLRSILDE